MTTAQTTDSQAVQTTTSSSEALYGQLMSTGNSMMLVAAALVSMMAMGSNMTQYLQNMTQEGMQLTTQGEEFSSCSNFGELFHTALDFRKEGQGDLMDSVILGTLDPDGEIPQDFKSLVGAGVSYGKEEVGIYEAYTEDPTQSGAEEIFVSSFKQEVGEMDGYFTGFFQDYSTSSEGQAAYASAYTMTQVEENTGKQILQMVQSFLGGFQTMEDAFLSVSQSTDFNQGMNN